VVLKERYSEVEDNQTNIEDINLSQYWRRKRVFDSNVYQKNFQDQAQNKASPSTIGENSL